MWNFKIIYKAYALQDKNTDACTLYYSVNYTQCNVQFSDKVSITVCNGTVQFSDKLLNTVCSVQFSDKVTACNVHSAYSM